MEEHWSYILRLFLAVIAGSVIGFERELHDKPAGFRTNILICVGAAMFTILSIAMVGDAYSDRARIAAGVVTGVGFLGAGAVVHFKGSVLGLTTAATIWTDASVGMAFGAGEYALGFAGTAAAAGVLFGLAYAEEWIASWRITSRFKIKLAPSLAAAKAIKESVRAKNVRIRAWLITNVEEEMTLRISLTGSAHRLEEIQSELIENEHVHSIKRV